MEKKIWYVWILMLVGFLSISCVLNLDNNDDTSTNGDNDSSTNTNSVVSAQAYSETDDTANDERTNAEATGITLNSGGLNISGRIDGENDTDWYQFNSGSMSSMSASIEIEGRSVTIYDYVYTALYTASGDYVSAFVQGVSLNSDTEYCIEIYEGATTTGAVNSNYVIKITAE